MEGLLIRGRKSCREDWYVRTFIEIFIAIAIALTWYMHVPNRLNIPIEISAHNISRDQDRPRNRPRGMCTYQRAYTALNVVCARYVSLNDWNIPNVCRLLENVQLVKDP